MGHVTKADVVIASSSGTAGLNSTEFLTPPHRRPPSHLQVDECTFLLSISFNPSGVLCRPRLC